MVVGHVSEEVKSVMPRSPDSEGMEKSNQDGRVRAGRSWPIYHVRRNREDNERSGGPGSGRDNKGQMRMKELSLLWRPQSTRLQVLRAVCEEGLDPGEQDHAGRGEVGPRGGAMCNEKGSSEEEASLANHRADDNAKA